MIIDFNEIIDRENLDGCYSNKKKNYIEQKIDREDIPNFENNGWEVKKVYKNGTAIVNILKNHKELMIDKLWTIFYRMGFSSLNNSPLEVDINNNYINIHKKIDIIAIDDETCLFIDCYSSQDLDRVTSFQKQIDDIAKSFRFLCNDVKERYGDKKFKYILSLNNYLLNEKDLQALKDNKIVLFDNENIDYYEALVEHLGSASRFQLLGNLFSKTTIKGMDERIPAIEGKMGNMTYYSFLIEPERLLKIGYVLHRNKANHDQMPTYQRLIKKDRLKSIREYVNNGGFFPNSLIISIDSKSGNLKFEKAPQSLQGAHSRVGTLYLPKEYQSAYIIDGQHRLYGYSDSKFAGSDTLPVIAFVNLEKDKQVKMFMDINENQKPVSKTLRNILSIDLNWNSEILNKRKEAVILNVCQSLGENSNSPLFGRVLTGEDSVNAKRCITIEYLKSAIEKTCFFNKYNKKNEITEKGLLDKIDSEETYNIVYNYLRNCLQVIADFCKEEWEKGSDGYLTINNTMVGIIRIIGDISLLTFKKNNYDINNLSIEQLYNDSAELLVNFAETINNLSHEKRNEIKTAKGGAAKDISWRILQVALNEYDSRFINDDLAKYIEENCTNYNDDGLGEILSIKENIIAKIKSKLANLIDWEQMYLPEDLNIKIHQKIVAQTIKNTRNGIDKELQIWDVLEFDDICKIYNYKSNWSSYFKNEFEYSDRQYTRIEIISIIKSLQLSESKINNGKHITKTEYGIINEFYQRIKGASE